MNASTDQPQMTRRQRLWSILVGLGFTFAMLWPILGERSRDSFPLSTYPMFTSERSTAKVFSLRLVAADGRLEASPPVPPKFIGGAELLVTSQAIRRAVRRGQAARMRLCRQVAARVAEDREYDWVDRIVLVRDRYDTLAYFREGPGSGAPGAESAAHGQRTRLAGCALPRTLRSDASPTASAPSSPIPAAKVRAPRHASPS